MMYERLLRIAPNIANIKDLRVKEFIEDKWNETDCIIHFHTYMGKDICTRKQTGEYTINVTHLLYRSEFRDNLPRFKELCKLALDDMVTANDNFQKMFDLLRTKKKELEEKHPERFFTFNGRKFDELRELHNDPASIKKINALEQKEMKNNEKNRFGKDFKDYDMTIKALAALDKITNGVYSK